MVVESVLALNEESLFDQWIWILDSFREVLRESGEPQIADSLAFLSQSSPGSSEMGDSVHLTQAYSIAFQLLGMAEQNAAQQFRSGIEQQSGMDALPALWGDCLRELLSQGWTADQIAARLKTMKVELVLTAHPTEAKRATVLAHHRRLFDRFQAYLVNKRQHVATDKVHDVQAEENDFVVKALLAILWRTGEIYLDKPDVQSERRNVLDYLTYVFPAVLRPLDQRLRQTWEQLGLPSACFQDPLIFPALTFGTWVGGDRDGHPLVTADVTRESLLEMRKSAVGLLHRHLLQLTRLLSLSAYWERPKPELLQALARVAEKLGSRGEQAIGRNPNEPWRQFLNTILARLPSTQAELEWKEGVPAICYRDAKELLDDLRLLHESLVEIGQRRIAEYAVQPVMRIVQTFGFHLAVLDIRQNSAFHDRAVEQLLSAAGFERTDFSQWAEEERLSFLQKELASKRPFARTDVSLGAEADATLATYRVLRDYRRVFGDAGLGSLIVSMTHDLSDLLVVYLLAREVGLMEETPQGLCCPLPVVPLFETVDDLQRSPEVYRAFLDHPITQRSQAAFQAKTHTTTPVGEVMIGYSDSNKDSGILSSLVNLRRAQKELLRVGDSRGVRIRFFHGRGGTISRGAGPTHRFIKSLPEDCLQGDLRLTEQGETIAQKYAHSPTAIYNLELFLAGVTRKSLLDEKNTEGEHPLENVLFELSNSARQAYTDLLETDGFLTFFRQATPIDAIEQSRIGSRPSRRTGQSTLADLRAIPWVFSWGQARFFLSGWYGVGSALHQLKQQQASAFQQVQEATVKWAPLHYLASNVATSLAAADLEIMHAYATMVEDSSLRQLCMGRIEAEFQLTQQMIEEIYGGTLASRRPNIQRMMNLRANGLKRLHHQQIGLLKAWRSYHRLNELPQAEQLVPQLLLSVNAIASGLGTTG